MEEEARSEVGGSIISSSGLRKIASNVLLCGLELQLMCAGEEDHGLLCAALLLRVEERAEKEGGDYVSSGAAGRKMSGWVRVV